MANFFDKAMNSIKDLDDAMDENLSQEIIGMESNSMGIEEAFLAENGSNEVSNSKNNSSSGGITTAQESIKENTNNEPKKFINLTNESTQSSARTKAFRFVNNSPHSMYKQKSRMKPAFRVETQPVQDSKRLQNSSESVIIEQKFGNGSDFQTTNDRKYVFQLNVKRPPGRPRKYPVDQPKPKRPQGRPRKYPVEVTGSTINTSKVTKKPIKETSTAHTLPIDTELISTTKRGRGRPKREDKELEEHHPDDNAYGHDQSFVIATAGASKSISRNNSDADNGASSGNHSLENTKS